MLYPGPDNFGTTRNLLVTSKDPNGVQVVVSATDESQEDQTNGVTKSDDEMFLHFDAGKEIDFVW